MNLFAVIIVLAVFVYAALQVYVKLNTKKKRTKPYSRAVNTEDSSNSTKPHRTVRVEENTALPSVMEGGIDTLYKNFEAAVAKFADRPCLGTRDTIKTHEKRITYNGEPKTLYMKELTPFSFITYRQFHQRVADYASGLLNIGLEPGQTGQDSGSSKIALYEETRLEWTLCEHACFRQNISVVTVYANLGEEAFLHALNQGKIQVIQTNAANLKIISSNASADNLPHLKSVIYSDELNDDSKAAVATLKEKGINVYTLSHVEQLGKENPAEAHPPTPDDIAVIMYTSGSTGMPKGVLIAHSCLIGCLSGVIPLTGVSTDDVYLSYLPLAHVLALAVENAALGQGASIGYGTSRTLTSTQVVNCQGDIAALRPTVFAGVPVIYDRIKGKVENKINHGNPVMKAVWNKAFSAKRAAIEAGQPSPFWDALIFNKIQGLLGGRVRLLVSGGAPLSAEAQTWLRVVFGCPVSQGYGLTETCGAATFQEFDDMSVGCAGAPVPSVEIKLVDVPEMNYFASDSKGEVWIRGAPVTKGYYLDEEKTAEEYHEGGWFSTGDIGEFTEDGRLKIIDRKKNLIKPPHGEYIAVERLESVYKNSSFVHNIMVYVDEDHYDCLGFINPDEGALKHWAQQNNVNDDDIHALCKNEKLKAAVLADLKAVGTKNKLKRIEDIKKIYIEPEEWTPDNGLLTAAMKLARPTLKKHYADKIKELYGGK